jgi:hypothetical protein
MAARYRVDRERLRRGKRLAIARAVTLRELQSGVIQG